MTADSGSRSLVGRQRELAQLEAFNAGPSGSGRLVVIVGEAGVGKTRLVDEVAASLARSSRVVRGRADEYEQVAFGLWLAPLRQLHLPRPGADPSVPVSEQRWEVVDVLTSALRVAGDVLLILDDLHWADDDSLWVLEHILDGLLDATVTIVATTRPGAEARGARWDGLYRRAEVMTLAGLDAGEVGELAARLGVPTPDARRLRERTGGNPLFVRELVLNGRAGATTVSELLGLAIEGAGSDVAGMLTVLAMAGPDAPREVLAAAAHVTLDALDARLATARRADLVRDDDGRLRLRHDLLAEAAMRRCTPSARRALHLALADAWGATPSWDAAANRARHLLLAIPAADAYAAAAEAIDVAVALQQQGRASDAAALMHLAGSVLDPRPEVAAELKVRVALAESEARWALDDIEGAAAAAAVAVARAAAADDPVLVASAEVAAVAHHNPMVPDPVRLNRLAQVDDALPPSHDAVDPTLRVRLRGRRAVLALSLPRHFDEAMALGDDAVRRARSIGDADVLVRALSDRLFVLATPADYDMRADAAGEILDLARSAGRPALALRGHEWRYASALSAGDLRVAVAALTDLEALAAIMPSPYWRWATALRRCMLVAILGDYEGAVDLTGKTRRLADGVAPAEEASGLEGAMRLGIAVLYGRDDHDAGQFSRENLASAGDAPLLFLQAAFALTEAMRGDSSAARRRLLPWLGHLDAGLRGPEGLPTIGSLAHTTVLLDWDAPATELRALLRPFAGRLVTGNGVMIDLPVDHHLGALALLDGDLVEAAAYARSAVEFARRMRAPALEARGLGLLAAVAERAGDAASAMSARQAAGAIAGPIGMRLSTSATPTPPAAAGAGRRVTLRLDKGRWFIDAPFGAGHVADSVGMAQLLRLVTAPGSDLSALDLAVAATGSAVVTGDLGPSLDAAAKRAYRRRIAELQADIEEADDHNDLDRASRHRLELDALLGELRAAVGLGGRDRPQGAGGERARINVSRTIRRAIAAIAGAVPDLGAHLQVSVRTGHQCSYRPEPAAALEWEVTT